MGAAGAGRGAGGSRPEGRVQHPANAAQGAALPGQHHRLGRGHGVHHYRRGVVAHRNRAGMAVLPPAAGHRAAGAGGGAGLAVRLQGEGQAASHGEQAHPRGRAVVHASLFVPNGPQALPRGPFMRIVHCASIKNDYLCS